MKRNTFVIGLIAILALLAIAAVSQAQMINTTLKNGMTVVIKENHAAPVVTVVAYVRAGHIFEEEFLGAGISHYCEHLVHCGTTT